MTSRETMTVREATRDDNSALVELAAECPMNGHMSLCVERRPDFFALNRLAGQAWRVGVIDGHNGPIACIGVAQRLAYIDGRPAPLAYVGDLKVHPAHRRRGAARALAAWALATAREMAGPGGPLMATVLGGNTAVEALQRDFVPGACQVATIRSHSVSLLWTRRLPRTALSVREASPEDLPAMAQVWRRFAAGRQFAPVQEIFPVGEPGLTYLLAHGPGGELAGFLGVWDQHGIKQMRVTGYSPRMAAARAAFNLAAPAFHAPRLPAPGGELSYRTAVNLCAPDPLTLRTLLLHACHRLRGRCSFLTIGLDTGDPLTAALKGMLPQPTDVALMVLGGPDGRTTPAHFEIATV